MKHSIIFVGLLDDVASTGETMKNQLFIQRFKEIFDKVHVFNAENTKHHPWKLMKLWYLCWRYPHAVVHLSASWGVAKPLLRFIKIIGRNKICYWVVGGVFHEKIKKGELPEDFYKSIYAIIVQNEYMKESLDEQGFTNVHYISNSKRIDYLPTITNKGNNCIKFVFLSRIHPTKGCKEIVESVKNLNKKGCEKKFSVDFYGKIDDGYSDFMSIIENVPNVSYKGFLDLTNKNGYLKLSEYDFMLFPTYWPGEGFPGIIIDAYISGLPVLASDWNLNKFYVLPTTGIIIPHHDQQRLEEEMGQIISGKYDINAMARNSQNEAMKYDNRNVITKQRLIEVGVY